MQSSILYFYRMEGEESFKPVYAGEEGPSTLEEDLHMSEDDTLPSKVRGWQTDDAGAFLCLVPACQHRSFSSIYTFTRHWTEKHQTPVKQYLCPEPYCEKRNIHPADLKKHIKDKHKMTLPKGHALKWRTVKNDRYLSPGPQFFGPRDRKLPPAPRKPNRPVIHAVSEHDIPKTASTKKRKFTKVPKSVEIVDETFSSDDEEPPKKVKSKVVVAKKTEMSEPQNKTANRTVSVNASNQPELTITVDENLSDDSIDQKIEEMMAKDGEESEGEEKKDVEKEKQSEKEKDEDDEGLEGVEVVDESDSGSSSGSSSGNESSDSEGEEISEESVDKSKGEEEVKFIPLETENVNVGTVTEIEMKLKEARESRQKCIELEEKWAEELRKRERYTWQTRYTKAVTALEEERELCRQLEKKVQETPEHVAQVEGLQKELATKDSELRETVGMLQETRTQLMTLAAKFEQSEEERKKLQSDLNDANKKLNSPKVKKCLELMKLMCGDKSEQ